MKQLALAPVKPEPKIETVKGSVTAHVVDHPVINDVRAPRWFGYPNGKAHAYLIPADGVPLDQAVCGKVLHAARLTESGKRDRCKTCVRLTSEDTRKRGSALVERTVDIVATGAQHGSPREAESRRACEVAEISGGAAKINAKIAGDERAGRKADARDTARKLDRRGPAAPVPEASASPIGQRDHGMLDGVAMVRGRNMQPVQPMWTNPATGQREVSSRGTMGGSLGRERADREVVGSGKPSARRSSASRRRYRKARTTERQITARLARQGNKS